MSENMRPERKAILDLHHASHSMIDGNIYDACEDTAEALRSLAQAFEVAGIESKKANGGPRIAQRLKRALSALPHLGMVGDAMLSYLERREDKNNKG